MTLGYTRKDMVLGLKGQRSRTVTGSITLHNTTSFSTTIAFHSHSLGGDTSAITLQPRFVVIRYSLGYSITSTWPYLNSNVGLWRKGNTNRTVSVLYCVAFQQCILHSHNEQFFQVGLLDRALILLGLAFSPPNTSLSSDFMVLCKCLKNILTSLFLVEGLAWWDWWPFT